LDLHRDLMRKIVNSQMKREKEENERMGKYLDLCFQMANEKLEGKWTYTDAEDFVKTL
jgi:hypothetical protein